MSKAIQPYLTCAWENFPNLSSQAKKKKKNSRPKRKWCSAALADTWSGVTSLTFHTTEMHCGNSLDPNDITRAVLAMLCASDI